jgi:hypothetical protein
MATIVAVQSGAWSDTSGTSPWPGGVKPGVGDIVQSGPYAIEIDEDIHVATLEATETGKFSIAAIAGDGTRVVAAAILNSRVTDESYTPQGALHITNAAGEVDLTGTITGGAVGAYMVGVLNEGLIGSITGDITGGSEADAYGIFSIGALGNITGDITGGSGYNAYGARCTAITTITGDIMGGSNDNAYGARCTAITTITGDITGGTGNYTCGMYCTNIGTITGDITGGSGFEAYGIFAYEMGNVTGAVSGGSGESAYGIGFYD